MIAERTYSSSVFRRTTQGCFKEIIIYVLTYCNRPALKAFDIILRLCYKDNHIKNDHIQAKGIPLKSGADPPL